MKGRVFIRFTLVLAGCYTSVIIITSALIIASCKDQGTDVPVVPVTPPHEPRIIWQHTNMPNRWPVQAILALSSTNGFCGMFNSAIFHSTDNGMNWAQSSSGMEPTEDILCLAVTVDSFLFAGSGGVGIFRSSDLGTTWAPLSEPHGIIWNLFPCSRGELIAGIFFRGVFRTTDNGSSWTAYTSGLDVQVLSVAKTSKGRLLAGTVSGLFASEDNGSSWFRDTLGIPSRAVNSLKIASNGYVLAGCDNGVYRSTDDGINWTTTNFPSISAAFCLAVGRTDLIFVGTMGDGVYLSTDYGNTWKHLETGLSDIKEIRSIAVSPEGYVFAGTYESGIFRTTESVSR